MKKILFSLIIIVALLGNINIVEAQYAHPATAIKSTNGNVQSDLNTLQSNIGASTVEVGLITAEIVLIQNNLTTMEASLTALAANDGTQELEIAAITAEIDLMQTNLGTLEDLVESNHAWTTVEIGFITSEIELIQANLDTIETRLDEHYANLETHELSINALITNDQTQETRIDSNENAFLWQCDIFGALSSGGKISGGVFTDDGVGGVNYTTMEVMFKTSDSQSAPLKYFIIPAGNIPSASLATDEVHYAYADYNNGVPQVLVTTDRTSIRTTDQFDLQRFYKNQTVVYIGTQGIGIFNFPRREHERTAARGVAERMSGGIIAEKSERYVTITSSTWYGGTSYVTKEAFDSSVTNFEHYYSYHAGTNTWTDNVGTYPSQIDNQKYNNTATGTLTDLTNNQYGVHWVYLGGSSKLSIVFGHNTYKLDEASALQPPVILPSYLEKFAVLVGRVIIKKDATVFTAINSSFDEHFATTVIEHNDTINRDTADAHPASAITYTDTYLMGVTTVQSAIDTIETWLGGWINDSFVYGFVEPLTATLSYDASNQTFTITGDHVIYINGKKVTKTTASKTHPATTGTHYFYYDSDGVLQTSTALWGNAFFNVAQIAYVYYNAEKVSAPQGLMFDEEHLYNMSTAMHYYLHTTRGSVSSDLFPIGNYDLAPAVPTDAGNQFSATGGTLVDEDHRETIADVPDGGYYPIFWREGVEGDWTWQSGITPVLVGSTYPMYNQLTGGSWTTTEISANNYVNMYTAVTNASDETYSVILIMGQQVYTTLAIAQAANPINTMSFGSLPFNEIIITNKITFRTGAGYGTIGKCRIESVESLAGITIRLGGAVVATSHSGLSNRTDPGSHPASAVSYIDTYLMDVTDIQSAIDTMSVWLSAIDVTNDSQDVTVEANRSAIVDINIELDSVAVAINNIDIRLSSVEAVFVGGIEGQVFTRTATGFEWATPASGVTDHLLLSNIGTKTHLELEQDITDLQANPAGISRVYIDGIALPTGEVEFVAGTGINLNISGSTVEIESTSTGTGATAIEDIGTYIESNTTWEFDTDYDTTAVLIYRNRLYQPRSLFTTVDVSSKTRVVFSSAINASDEIILISNK